MEDGTLLIRGKFKARAGRQFAIRKAVLSAVQTAFRDNGIRAVPKPMSISDEPAGGTVIKDSTQKNAGRMIRNRRLARCMILMPLLTAGASPRGTLLPVAGTVPGASTVDMLVATTRMRATDPQDFFSGDRGPDLSFAEFTVSIPPEVNRKEGEVQWPRSVPGNPATDYPQG